MSKESDNNNIYQIPQTFISSELSKGDVDYIDYIYDEPKENSVEVDVTLSDTSIIKDETINTRQTTFNRESYARTPEKTELKEIDEIIEISQDIKKCRADFIAQGLQLDSIKSGLIGAIFGIGSRKPVTLEQLKSEESKIGSSMFGLDSNVRTEFFNDNEQSWFFYQEVTGRRGEKDSVTLHYEVHPEGILRIKNNEINGCVIEGEELKNFTDSVRIYHDRIIDEIYKKNSDSGELAA